MAVSILLNRNFLDVTMNQPLSTFFQLLAAEYLPRPFSNLIDCLTLVCINGLERLIMTLIFYLHVGLYMPTDVISIGPFKLF